MSMRTFLLAVALMALLVLGSPSHAAGPRALEQGEVPVDRRLGERKNLNGYFPFSPPKSVEAWQARAEQLRRQVQVSQGLWPMPELGPLRPVIHGRVERDDFTVERVYFESYPGFFVTGSLFRPRGDSQRKRPGVLCPHGHWPDGRFYDAGEAAVRNQIVDGAERFELSGRYPLQARCVQLARMGCVVFHYDMVGYADSQQLAHRPGSRDALNAPARWGFFSPQAELRLQTMMGLQSYNSVRALDFLLGLPDVDPDRIAVTGASGGGTQTFVLAAIDPRVAVSVPAVMVSTSMQGGCTCENSCYLRTGSGNIELAGLFAPQPQGLLAADDWTREMATKGYPELQQLYELLGAKDRVELRALTHFKHNYNYVSRAFMYRFVNKHLRLGHKEPIVEEDFRPLSVEELTVWNDQHPAPPAGDDFERDLLAGMTRIADEQLAALAPGDEPSQSRFRQVVGGGWQTLIGRLPSEVGRIEHELIGESNRGSYQEFVTLLKVVDHGEELPAVFLMPDSWNKQVVIWIDPMGKGGMYETDDTPIVPVRQLLERGYAVAGVDLLGQGEFTTDGVPLVRQPLNASGRDLWTHYAGYTYGYNPSLFASRVHDILAVIAFAGQHERQPEAIHLVGAGGAGRWVAAACAQCGDTISTAAIDTAGFRFAHVEAIDHADFLPGSVKYGDLPALLTLAAPTRLYVAGETQIPASANLMSISSSHLIDHLP